MFPCILCLAVAPPEPLAVALEKAVVPLLEALSTRGNESAWSFAYKDADLEVQFCAGPIMRGDGARKCHGKRQRHLRVGLDDETDHCCHAAAAC